MDVTADFVRSLLDYDPVKGEMIWRERPREWFGNLRAFRMWHAKNCGNRAGCIDSNGYVSIRFSNTNHRAHRIAWLHFYGHLPRGDLDHINGDRTDFRIINLREATPSQNAMNRCERSDNSSGAKGITYSKQVGRWQAFIGKDSRRIHLGYFDSKEEAIAVRKEAEKEYHGEFARAA